MRKWKKTSKTEVLVNYAKIISNTRFAWSGITGVSSDKVMHAEIQVLRNAEFCKSKLQLNFFFFSSNLIITSTVYLNLYLIDHSCYALIKLFGISIGKKTFCSNRVRQATASKMALYFDLFLLLSYTAFESESSQKWNQYWINSKKEKKNGLFLLPSQVLCDFKLNFGILISSILINLQQIRCRFRYFAASEFWMIIMKWHDWGRDNCGYCI